MVIVILSLKYNQNVFIIFIFGQGLVAITSNNYYTNKKKKKIWFHFISF